MIKYLPGKPSPEEHAVLCRAIIEKLRIEPLQDSMVWALRKEVTWDTENFIVWKGTMKDTDGGLLIVTVLLRKGPRALTYAFGTKKAAVPISKKGAPRGRV